MNELLIASRTGEVKFKVGYFVRLHQKTIRKPITSHLYGLLIEISCFHISLFLAAQDRCEPECQNGGTCVNGACVCGPCMQGALCEIGQYHLFVNNSFFSIIFYHNLFLLHCHPLLEGEVNPDKVISRCCVTINGYIF